MDGAEIVLPSRGKVVWLLPPGLALPGIVKGKVPFQTHGPLVYFDAEPGLRFQIGGYRFSTSSVRGVRRPVSRSPGA